MVQNWQKQAHIYRGRAQVPTVWVKDDKVWRIFFADRTPENRSFIRYVDVEAGRPENVLFESKESLLPRGRLGTFDRDGQMPSWVLPDDNGIRLYYIGWSQRKDVPYHNSMGLAISKNGGETFEKFSEGPILADSIDETYFTGTSCVIREASPTMHRHYYSLFYLSCTEWVDGATPEPRYHLKQRTSADGIYWYEPYVAVDYKSPKEGGICRASVIRETPTFWRMWYCYRDLENYRTDKNRSYRIGYAESKAAGRAWVRKDEDVNLQISENGWDSQMLCYPHVIQHEGRYFMFYNGNTFGQTGFGYATWAA